MLKGFRESPFLVGTCTSNSKHTIESKDVDRLQGRWAFYQDF